MSQIIGYGEDALTYWAITAKLDEILRTLGDNSYPSATIIVYRPSFGRPGRFSVLADKDHLSAEFGEFDAILGTQQAVYLVESKWDLSITPRNTRITLKGVQSRRHEIMRWYLQTWRANQPKDWTEFVAQHETPFQTLFPGNKMAPADSRLALNLEFVIKMLSNCGSHVQDAVLFIGQSTNIKPIGVKPDSFKLVILQYHPINPSGYFQIQNI